MTERLILSLSFQATQKSLNKPSIEITVISLCFSINFFLLKKLFERSVQNYNKVKKKMSPFVYLSSPTNSTPDNSYMGPTLSLLPSTSPSGLVA